MLTKKQLNAMRNCAPLLPEPAPEVVEQLLLEIDRLRAVLLDIVNPEEAVARSFTGSQPVLALATSKISVDVLRAWATEALGQ